MLGKTYDTLLNVDMEVRIIYFFIVAAAVLACSIAISGNRKGA
jgi:hypothetical protein